LITLTGYIRPFLVLITAVTTFSSGLHGLAVGLIAISLNEMLGLRLGLSHTVHRTHPKGRLTGPLARLRRRLPGLRRRGRSRFPTFDSVAADIGWSERSPRDADAYLWRHIQRIAEARLSHQGLSLAKVAATPGLGEQLVGPVTWPFVDPGRPRRRDSERKGVSVDTVNRMLTELESI
jgi:hypothetical protein